MRNWCTTATMRCSADAGTCDHQRTSSALQAAGRVERSERSGSSVSLWYCGSSSSGLAITTKNWRTVGPSATKAGCAS